MREERGFTLVELMVTVAIVSIIAAIAVPAYNDYVRRSQLTEAFNNLSAYRVKMEQYYQDNRSYQNSGGTCGATLPSSADVKYFTYTCAVDTTAGAAAGQSYKMTATGNASSNVSGFVFTINEQNVKATTGISAAWGSLPSNASSVWVDKKP